MLVIFSGCSGVGKNTVIAELLKSEGFKLLPTYTTRVKRETESDGNPYFFISSDEFEQKIKENEFYEHETVHGNYYGTSKKLLKEKLQYGDILLKDIDVLGTHNLVDRIGADVKLVTIFLKVDSKEVLIERLKQRKEKDIEKRLSRYEMEQKHRNEYDYIITNNCLEETKGFVLDIISFESSSSYLYSAQKPEKIDGASIAAYAQKLKDGEILEPIKVAVSQGKAYIVKGHHRYLASVKAGVKIAREIVVSHIDGGVDQAEWLKLVEAQKNQL